MRGRGNLNPRDVFGIIIRTIGLLCFVVAVVYSYGAIAVVVFPAAPHRAPLGEFILAAMAYFILAIVFLLGARWIIRLTYTSEG